MRFNPTLIHSPCREPPSPFFRDHKDLHRSPPGGYHLFSPTSSSVFQLQECKQSHEIVLFRRCFHGLRLTDVSRTTTLQKQQFTFDQLPLDLRSLLCCSFVSVPQMIYSFFIVGNLPLGAALFSKLKRFYAEVSLKLSEGAKQCALKYSRRLNRNSVVSTGTRKKSMPTI